LKTTLGGKGLATNLLLERNPPSVDPLSPDNVLLQVSFAKQDLGGKPLRGIKAAIKLRSNK
jgi:aldehyde:ferredoxin oxidoreductase